MKKRFFTLTEARELLPRVRREVALMVQIASRLEAFQEDVRQYARKGNENAGGAEGTAYVENVMALQLCVARLNELGCLVKGVQEGLVDFPHMKDGREVCLCWKHGEDTIRFWHEVDAGFAGREPIVESGDG